MNKLTLFFLGMVLMIALSCSKTNNNPPANDPNNPGGGGGTTPTEYFTFKVNGVQQDFKAMTLVKDNPDDIKQFYLVGQKSDLQLPNLLFTLNYKAPGWVDGLSYALDENDFVNFAEYKTPSELVFKSKATPASANSGLRIRFDKITLAKGQFAIGTFSGTLQLEENVTTVVITEGKFKVKFSN
jgi:hypothetical protein